MTWNPIVPVRFALLLSMLVCGACHERAPRSAIATLTRDSAEVQIVENREDRADVAAIRTMGPPDLTIGLVDGPGEYLFDRIAGAARLADGRIVIVDRGNARLRFFDTEGLFLHATAGQGAGPGEFDRPAGLRRLPGDTLLVWDLLRRGRLNYFDGAGAFVRETHYNLAAVMDAQVRDSTMAFEGIPVRDDVLFLPGQRGGIVPPTYPFRAQLVFMNEARSIHLGAWPMIDGASDVVPYLRNIPGYTVRERYAVGGDPVHIHIGNSEHHEFRTFDETGALLRIIRTMRAPVEIEREATSRIHALHRAQVEAGNGDVAAVDRHHASLAFPAAWPPFLSLHATMVGGLWVMRFPMIDETDTRFDVYDEEGTLHGTIAFEGSNKPLEIGSDYVVMLRMDENRVEFIDVYLNRSFPH